MEFGSIQRDLLIEAPVDIVFEIVSTPEHLRQWWPDDARFDSVAGAPGELVWTDAVTGVTKTVEFTVVEVSPPLRFAFRWCYAIPERSGDSLLVTFDLTAVEGGTRVRMTETGFREMGWEVAVLEEYYRDHVNGWAHYVPALGAYVARLVASR
jgi:uncharacterized protein YndB with AHSA1/START domain